MNYKEYYESYYNYKKAKIKLRKIQNKITSIINSLLSITSQIKENATDISHNNDKMSELIAKKSEFEEEEALALDLLSITEKRKNKAEQELRQSTVKSNDIRDLIYIKYYIEHCDPKTISFQLSFSKSYVYKVLNEIKEFIVKYDKEHAKECKKV